MIRNTAPPNSGGAPPDRVREANGYKKKNGLGSLTASWEIRNPSGEVQAVHERYETGGEENAKKCLWRLPGGTLKDGLKGRETASLPLYGAHDLHPEVMMVAAVEGEPARDQFEKALREAGYPREQVGVIGTVTGASGTPSREVLEVLRGFEVVLWPDADEPGSSHMRRVAERLQEVAALVRIYHWPEAEEKDDAADHPAVISGDGDALGRLMNDLLGAPEWKPEPDDPGSVYSPHIQGGFGENKKPPKNPLPIKTVDEILEEAGEEVPWIIENVLARGALTDFSGLAKKGGKTTFWCHAIAAGARGEHHAGFVTEPAKYLYLSEQGGNFAGALRESGLAEYPEHVSIVQYKDVSVVGWDTLINQAGAEAKRRGMDALVVDTFAVFARLKGSEENDAGPVADRMRVLRLVAQKYDIGVVLIRHSGKDGSPRGSSAFEAEADICVNLSRPEGRHAPSVRKIAGIGRYGEWERNIQLTDGRFVSLGADDKIEFNKAVKLIKAVLPISPEDGMRKQQILDTRTETDDVSASTVDRALGWLVKQGDVGEKQLMNQRGKPKVFWLAHKPPGGGDDGGLIYSHQTPFIKGENKSGNDGPTENGHTPGDDGEVRI
ncbi:MAG: AAA family ATPase [Actinomycetota bacterium]|nr:AAA family ATPase [Actinomycetota bacterium]